MRAALLATETRSFFPKVNELLVDCEAVRQRLLSQHVYDPSACESCEGTGWEPVMVDGVKRVTRCGCFRMFQAKLTQLGVTSQPLSLPAAREVSDDTAA
jgi:hypothetical protein